MSDFNYNRLRNPAIERELRWLRIQAWTGALVVALATLGLAATAALLIWKSACR